GRTLRVYLATFGCRANQCDTEPVRATLEACGVRIVEAPPEARDRAHEPGRVAREAEADLPRPPASTERRAGPRARAPAPPLGAVTGGAMGWSWGTVRGQ